MDHRRSFFGITWFYPRSFINRYYDESRVYIRWGYLLTLFPLLGLMPYAFLVLDEDVAKPFALTHAFLAIAIGVLIFLTYRSKNGVVVSALTFVTYVAGGTSLNVAAFLNSNPPVIYTIAGQFECMLMLFVAVRAPWVLTIPYGVAVIAVFVYIVTGVWSIEPLDASIIAVALVFILFLVSIGCYARDKQTFELYLTQNSIRELEKERVKWSHMLTRFLSHEINNQIAAITLSFHLLSEEQADGENRYIVSGMESVDELRQLVQRAAEAVDIDDLVESLDAKPVDLMGLINELIRSYQVRLSEGRSIEVDNLYENHKYFVWGDYLLLKQMLGNILDNAVRHSNPDTAITIFLTKQGTLEIADEGGSLPDDIESVFAFGGNEDSKKPGLYGLGLYLARKIAVAHEGSIVAKRPERFCGAVFLISLPEVKVTS
jgi:signal transduction histidine kinase